MSVANAIKPNNFQIFSGSSPSLNSPEPEAQSTGFEYVGEEPVSGSLSYLSLPLDAGDWRINYCCSVIGSNASGTTNRFEMKTELLADATVIDTSEFLRLTDVDLGGTANYCEGSVNNSVVVRLTVPRTISLEFTVGPNNEASSTNIGGVRGIVAVKCDASGNFQTV